MKSKHSWSKTLECGLTAKVLSTDSLDGNLSISQPAEQLHQTQRRIIDAPWSYLKQVHGGKVFRIKNSGDHQVEEGDGMITTTSGIPMAIQVADCAPIALICETSVIGIIHAGWRGLLAGIVENACTEMRKLGGYPTIAVVGPCIYPKHYEFGSGELKHMTREFGPTVESETKEGTPALDIPETAKIALRRSNVLDTLFIGGCTASSEKHWSHRVGGNIERQAMIAWLEEAS
tara:strand:- start:5613 stop:6308 length:696 start_codon:yes stop_codon:yes gene_type:complete